MTSKVLFFDIDGTLVDKARGVHEMPEGLTQKIKELQSRGFKMFICSGRPKPLMVDGFLEMDFDGFILANGAHVEIDGKSIYENRMDEKVSKKVCDVLDELNCDYSICTARYIYLDPSFDELYTFFARVGMGHIFTREFNRDEVIGEALKIEANVTNRDKQRIEAMINEDLGYVIVVDQHGSENCFEMYNPTISKATGIQKVLDYFGLDVKDSYGFGDGLNDLEMIQYVGCGVAMGNAVDELKKVADVVCDDIENNGLVKILTELFG